MLENNLLLGCTAMLKIERLVVFFISIIINVNINVAYGTETSWGFLSKILGKHSSSPLVIILNPESQHHDVLRTDNKQLTFSQKQVKTFEDKMDDKNTMYWLKAVLRSTGDENDPSVQKTHEKFKSALRDRCTSYYECTVTCIEKKKPKKSCAKTCQEVYDYLMMCNPPGGKKKPKKKYQKKDSCERDSCESDSCERDSCAESDECGQAMNCKPVFPSHGKTMPPSWR